MATNEITATEAMKTNENTATEAMASNEKTATEAMATNEKTATEAMATNEKTATEAMATNVKTATEAMATNEKTATEAMPTVESSKNNGRVMEFLNRTGAMYKPEHVQRYSSDYSSNSIQNGDRQGKWTLTCDSVTEDDFGQTEADLVFDAVRELCSRNAGLFQSPPKRYKKTDQTDVIYCNTSDGTDVEELMDVAEKIRNCVFFPCAIYYTGQKRRDLFYMHTPEGELYKNNRQGFKLIQK